MCEDDVSSTSVDLSLSGLYATILLSLDLSWIVSHQSEVLKHWSSLNIVILNGFSDSRNYRLSLPGEPTTMNPDIDIQQACVLSDHEWQ